MFGIIGKLLGSDTVISKGMELIDDLHTSTEEELAAKTKAKTDLIAAYAPFKPSTTLLSLNLYSYVCIYYG